MNSIKLTLAAVATVGMIATSAALYTSSVTQSSSISTAVISVDFSEVVKGQPLPKSFDQVAPSFVDGRHHIYINGKQGIRVRKDTSIVVDIFNLSESK